MATVMRDADPETDRIPVIDVDTHPVSFTDSPEVCKHLPERWRDYVGLVGFRGMVQNLNGDRPRQRAFAARHDAFSPDGAPPGTDPHFVREQLLDGNDVSGAILNDLNGFHGSAGRPCPEELSLAMARAFNQCRIERWMASDDRWFASINVPHEATGEAAAAEIRHCKEQSGEYNGRWVQVLMQPDNERPAGHQKYWPIFEAAEHHGIPVAYHVLGARRITGTGTPNYYFEEHTDFAANNFPVVGSLMFEGVFERFPKLKVALIELAWSWAVPFAWRLDHTYNRLRCELPHVPRKPSEYLAEHFWFSTQPMEEPENAQWFDDVYQLFEDTIGDKLMYSSDYPHWDYDMPSFLPHTLSLQTRRKILGETASKLYGIPLCAGTGLAVELATA